MVEKRWDDGDESMGPANIPEKLEGIAFIVDYFAWRISELMSGEKYKKYLQSKMETWTFSEREFRKFLEICGDDLSGIQGHDVFWKLFFSIHNQNEISWFNFSNSRVNFDMAEKMFDGTQLTNLNLRGSFIINTKYVLEYVDCQYDNETFFSEASRFARASFGREVSSESYSVSLDTPKDSRVIPSYKLEEDFFAQVSIKKTIPGVLRVWGFEIEVYYIKSRELVFFTPQTPLTINEVTLRPAFLYSFSHNSHAIWEIDEGIQKNDFLTYDLMWVVAEEAAVQFRMVRPLQILQHEEIGRCFIPEEKDHAFWEGVSKNLRNKKGI